jgi:hypothetical protein
MVTGRGRKSKSYVLPCLIDDQLDRRRVISGPVTQNSTMFLPVPLPARSYRSSTSALTLDIGDAHVIEAPCTLLMRLAMTHGMEA